MKIDCKKIFNLSGSTTERRRIYTALVLIIIALGIYLVWSHYIKAYSDPEHWLRRAQWLMAGTPQARRPPVYPAVLGVFLSLAGPFWVFLSNVPLLLLVAGLSFGLLRRLIALESTGDKQDYVALLSGLACVCILVTVKHDVFLELVNPFREALAFSLMLGSFCLSAKYIKDRNWLTLAFSGILLGLAIGARETIVLVLPVFFLNYLYSIAGSGKIPWRNSALAFGFGLFIGLLPFLINNAFFSGHFWIPSYASSRFTGRQNGSLQVPKDLPIPGMSFSYFFSIGKETWLFFLDNYGWAGMAALLAGVIACLRKRWIRTLLVYALSALIFSLFYACYHYVKARYLLCVDLFITPLMGIGAATFISGALRVAGHFRPPLYLHARRSLPVVFTAIVVFVLASNAGNTQLLKVWQVKTFLSEIMPHIDKPCVFLSNSAHYREMLAWLTQSSHAPVGYEMCWHKNKKYGLDKALTRVNHSFFAKFNTNNYYFYGSNHPQLLKNVFDFVPVIDFSDLTVTPDHYGRKLRDTLYSVRPWSLTNVTYDITVDNPGTPAIMQSNCFRLWDYPGRTFCKLYVNKELIEPAVTNGVQFHRLAPEIFNGKTNATIQIVSDAPLPQSPQLNITPLNKPLEVKLKPLTYHRYLSTELVDQYPLDSGSILYDKGALELPVCADTNQLVFADILVTEYREEPTRFEDNYEITMTTETGTVSWPSPGRRQTKWLSVQLGKSHGELRMAKVQLDANIPSREIQRQSIIEGKTSDYVWKRLSVAKIYAVDNTLRETLDINIGSNKDSQFLLGGFHKREEDGKRTARWTSGHGKVRLPVAIPERNIRITVTICEHQPECVRTDPVFMVNNRQLEPAEKSRSDDNRNVVSYVLHASRDTIQKAKTYSVLEIVSPGWRPSKIMESRDTRKLGHMVSRISVRPNRTEEN